MIASNKILPIALVAALIGGTVAALVMHRPSVPAESSSATTPATGQTTASAAQPDPAMALKGDQSKDVAGDQTAFKARSRGYDAANGRDASLTENARYEQNRVAYRPSRGRYVSRPYYASPRRAYYDYQPRHRTFWQKHRDKLTVAMGSGGGALIGGLIGGGKGAGIGALAGGGGSALYTYKIRHRHRTY
jgi:hypothetical protein